MSRRKLIAWADVYVENFTVGAVDRLGIGYDVARKLNPAIIMASSCLMGQTGPARDFAGFGYHAAAIAGFFEITGWPDRPPAGPWSAYTDIIAPRFLLLGIMGALEHRRRTGEGQYIDISQMESALQYLAPQLIDFNLSGHAVSRNGNRSETAAHTTRIPAPATTSGAPSPSRPMRSGTPCGVQWATRSGPQTAVRSSAGANRRPGRDRCPP